MKNQINVVIITRNRSDKLLACLNSLFNCTGPKFPIFIIDQSSNHATEQLLAGSFANNQRIQYFHVPVVGKSKGLNFALKECNSEILAFTDDDCVVSPSWIEEILSAFQVNQNLSCVAGNTLPYNNIPKLLCPPTITGPKNIFFSPIHHSNIGYGNNFAIKYSVFDSVGNFKHWLGPGSIGSNCEDGEIIIRMLVNGLQIQHNPKVIVYHNKRLQKHDFNNQYLSYIQGEFACYGYYMLKNHSFARKILANQFSISLAECKHLILDLIRDRNIQIDRWKLLIKMMYKKLLGFCIGSMYLLLEKLSVFIINNSKYWK